MTGKVLRAFELDEGKGSARASVNYLEERAKVYKGTLNHESLKALRRGSILATDPKRPPPTVPSRPTSRDGNRILGGFTAGLR